MSTPTLAESEAAAEKIIAGLTRAERHELLLLLLQRRAVDGQNGRPHHPVLIQIFEPKIQMFTAQ